MEEKICLGIESTAHTFGAGIITDKGEILANEIAQYTTKHGGIIPNEASLHHKKYADIVINNALKKAGIKIININLVSFSKGPGLAPCLLVGLEKAGGQIYLIKKSNNANESIEHFFLTKLIAQEIKKYTENIIEYSTFGPDITFQVEEKGKNEWYAIEIETGKTLQKNPRAIEEKTSKNNYTQHLKEWFYVVTDASKKPEYEKHHTTLTRTEIKEKIKELFESNTNL